MSKPGFEKIKYSDNRLFGPRKLLLCGFSAPEQSEFTTLLKNLAITDLPLIWLSQDREAEAIASIVELPDGSGFSQSSSLPRAIIAGGITENELHQLIAGYRKAALAQSLWAALTPTSIQWPLNKLLNELVAERRALSAAKHRSSPS